MNYDNTTSANRQLIMVFKNPDNAERAFNHLTSNGFDKDNITVIMSDETRDKNFSNTDMPEDSLGSKAVEGMGVGGAVGGTIGAITAAIAAIGTTLLVPGLGVIVAGPIAAAFAGAGAGSAVGGMVGALIGSGISDQLAKQYEQDIREGAILIGIKANDENYNTLSDELNGFNAL